MGVITRCCTRELIISNSQIYIDTNSEFDNKIEKIKELPSNYDKNNSFQFIISDKFYELLTQKVSTNSIIKEMSKQMNISEIILLMGDLLKYMDNLETHGSNKENIAIIKSNAKLSFRFSLNEMQKQKYEEKYNYFIIKALGNMCLIVQSILLLKNEDNLKSNIYQENIWKNKDIVKETRKYGFQGAFFILLYKNRKISLNEEEKGKIKNELLQEINQYYKISTNFYNDLILN